MSKDGAVPDRAWDAHVISFLNAALQPSPRY
jgi:hypothetical protein